MTNIIEAINISKSYKDFSIDNVNMTLESGSIMGLVGANGAGKTTLIKIILGILSKDSGVIKLFGREYGGECSVKDKIGVVFDECQFPECLTANDLSGIMDYMYVNWNEKTFRHCLTEFNIPEKKKIESFSKGMKKKLMISVAVSHHPILLVLDEVTSDLDPLVRQDVLRMLKRYVDENRERAILFSTHILSDLEKISDKVVFISEGTIVLSDDIENISSIENTMLSLI